jgi:hypothetical protein
VIHFRADLHNCSNSKLSYSNSKLSYSNLKLSYVKRGQAQVFGGQSAVGSVTIDFKAQLVKVASQLCCECLIYAFGFTPLCLL